MNAQASWTVRGLNIRNVETGTDTIQYPDQYAVLYLPG